jgi:hypothetical protein
MDDIEVRGSAMPDLEAMNVPGWHGGDGNAAYLDKTLRHHAIELGFTERVNWRTLAALFFRAFVVSLAVWIVLGFVLLFFLVAGAGAAAGAVYFLAMILSGATFWLVFLTTRLPEPIAEWRVLLADRRDTADAVYSQIAGALRERRIPLYCEYLRIPTDFGSRDVSNRLVLKDGVYDAYVSVFGYGTSLYLGWMMWRSRRGYQLLARFIADVVSGMLGQNSPEQQMMRTERPRAMREAVHAVCREGLFVGIERREVPLSFGFPYGVPPVQAGPTMPDAPPPNAWGSDTGAWGWAGADPHPATPHDAGVQPPPPPEPGTWPGETAPPPQ